MKMKGPFLPSKQLLVFNGAYVLIAVVRSLHSAADFQASTSKAYRSPAPGSM